ncbi:acyl-CoA dehydrogenase [Arthrobacter sp. MYb213]|uniref:acyl-CoA dehydrogenase n=1 Tax=Arthrobacter sp. MYb213 TaxID=1848595 RepID=UPI000CFAE6DA|nr:acyl-CoA dehydrogenase [Arthrobacter sp. MYb213]PRB70403.1 acyl-CoA dehydrogenase [Arthrobacter sp. MYb213]
MALSLTEEQVDLAAAVADFTRSAVDLLATRQEQESLAAGQLPSYWDELLDNGLHALHLSEELGGQGGTLVETAIVLEEFGHRHVSGPFLSTVLASAAVNLAENREAHTTVLEDFAAGATGSLILASANLSALKISDGWAITGAVPALSAIAAKYLVVGFDLASTVHYAIVESATAGLSRVPAVGADLGRDASTVVFENVVIGETAVLTGVTASQINALHTGFCGSEAAGIMRWASVASSDYAKIREQFSTPIGSFQAIKHKCAQLLINAEMATAAAWSAVVSVTQDQTQQRLAAASALEAAIVPSIEAITEAITVFGGIGFTWEHDAHLYWRRAISLNALSSPHEQLLIDAGEAALGAQRSIDVELADEDASFRRRVAELLNSALALEDEHQAGRWHTRGSRRNFLADNGLAAPHWPAPYGLGATPAQQVIIAQEYARHNLTQPSSVIGEWAMPTILAFGSDALKEQFTLPTLRGELIWCQLFSEPGAGSDLAGLSTRAIKVEDGWKLSGQKVWTSGAHEAHWGICLARTDPTVAKHRGLSYFLVDMSAAGVDVRPLRQATGESEFNEVFLDDVFVADEYLLGEPGQGWRITATTLQNERTQISSGVSIGTEDGLRQLINEQSYIGCRENALEVLGRSAAISGAIGAMNLRETLKQVNGLQPGAGSSLAKVAHARLSRQTAGQLLKLAGPSAIFAHAPADAVTAQLAVPQVLIGGGTTEIQLNVIAERIIGLPRG